MAKRDTFGHTTAPWPPFDMNDAKQVFNFVTGADFNRDHTIHSGYNLIGAALSVPFPDNPAPGPLPPTTAAPAVTPMDDAKFKTTLQALSQRQDIQGAGMSMADWLAFALKLWELIQPLLTKPA
jgi:hypothetical protein